MRLSTVIIALAISGSAAMSYAENGCHSLHISVNQKYRICKSGATCSSGTVEWNGSGVYEAYVKQRDGNAPSCKIPFCYNDELYKIEYFISEIKVHQNLCALKAGNISVSHVSGRVANYTTKEGSFLHSRAGNVHVDSFQ